MLVNKLFTHEDYTVALQAQWGWAYGLDVVLLAAGYNKPQAGSSGSGIYQGRFGAVDYYMSDTEGSKLLVSSVLKNQPSAKRTLTTAGKNFKYLYSLVRHIGNFINSIFF